jgi:hypothetical protein
MCARLELNDTSRQPGQALAVWLEERHSAWLIWAGFARSESLGRWLSMGGQLVDIPAQRFAERSNRTRRLIWQDVPIGKVVRGIVDSNSGKPLLKVVTRAATPEEYARFEHPRMPFIEAPRVSAEQILELPPVGEHSMIIQSELFAM